VDRVGRFYQVAEQDNGTHLALRWNGRVRYTIPRETVGQQACWKVFHSGWLEVPLRAMACLPRFVGDRNCIEGSSLSTIRKRLGNDVGHSGCRSGTEGVWAKDTILFLDNRAKPLYIVKAGTGNAVNTLLDNEANWLHKMQNQDTLRNHIPKCVAHCSGADLSFVAQSVLSGDRNFRLGRREFEFLQKLQAYSLRVMHYEDSILHRKLDLRIKELRGLLPVEWSIRLDQAMRRIEENMSGSPVLLVAAHNDFAPWNICIQDKSAFVFDWEFAADEHFPLCDPLHFALMPMALKNTSLSLMIQKAYSTIRLCQQWMGEDRCYKAEGQMLAYLVNLCTLYLWADRGQRNTHPALVSYARMIDRICDIS
jgi:hypothetical protein